MSCLSAFAAPTDQAILAEYREFGRARQMRTIGNLTKRRITAQRNTARLAKLCRARIVSGSVTPQNPKHPLELVSEDARRMLMWTGRRIAQRLLYEV